MEFADSHDKTNERSRTNSRMASARWAALVALCAVLAGRTRGDAMCRKLSGDDLLRLRTTGAPPYARSRGRGATAAAENRMHALQSPTGFARRALADAVDPLQCALARIGRARCRF